jgi:hypothetical protein
MDDKWSEVGHPQKPSPPRTITLPLLDEDSLNTVTSLAPKSLDYSLPDDPRPRPRMYGELTPAVRGT